MKVDLLQEFDCLVIGKGLVGSAAARYLTGAGNSVAIIGPDEPDDWKSHRGVFASHYDQGRITRVLDSDIVWARLAQRSIDRYREIEQSSGINFFSEVGFLKIAAASSAGLDYLKDNAQVGRELGVDFEHCDEQMLASLFPYLQFNSAHQALFEKQAGYINPRQLVQAQLSIAAGCGCRQIRETVCNVSPVNNGVVVETLEGHCYFAHKVLIAAGAFANCHNLVPQKLDLSVFAETVLFIKIDADRLEQLKMMPALIYRLEENSSLEWIYVLPPILYPDGSYYLKVGAAGGMPLMDELSMIQRWFAGDGEKQLGEKFRQAAVSIMPILEGAESFTKPCIYSNTPTQRPFIDELVLDCVYVVAGCCGGSAKSSDAIGCLAAELIASNIIDPAFGQDAFKATLRSQ